MAPLLCGMLGGAITFGVLLVASIMYLGLLQQFQILVSGLLAIVASVIALSGVYLRISHDKRMEENKIKREAFAFATALLIQTRTFETSISFIYRMCHSSIRRKKYALALERYPQRIKELRMPELFDASWENLGLLNPDVGVLIHSITLRLKNIQDAADLPDRLTVPPEIADLDCIERERWEDQAKDYLETEIEGYEELIQDLLAELIGYLEAEADDYAIQLGLDEKRKWLRAQAEARRAPHKHDTDTGWE